MGNHARSNAAVADQLTVRRNNLSVVLSHLRDAGPRSRARVADETGLNKATVSSLVAELIDRRLVAEGDTERGAVGRPGQTISLGGRLVRAVGVEINIDYVSALVLDLAGGAMAERRLSLDTAHLGPETVIAAAARLVQTLVAESDEPDATIVGVTIAVPGLVETLTGTLHHAPNLKWRDVAAVELLRHELDDPDYPIRLDNEANLAALAELRPQRAAGQSNLILLTGAAGVGGGIIVDGHLVRGSRGYAGEVGHIPIDPAGKRCGCGRRGCWETVVGLNALLARAAGRNDPVRDPELDLDQRLGEINRRAQAGHTRTLRSLDEVGHWLGLGASTLVNVFNPEVLVLGGYFAALGQWLSDPLSAALRDHVFAPDAGGCRVEVSALGFSAAVRGGALRALDAVFDDPTVVAA